MMSGPIRSNENSVIWQTVTLGHTVDRCNRDTKIPRQQTSRRTAEGPNEEGERKETHGALDGTRGLANRKLKTTFLCGVYTAANKEKKMNGNYLKKKGS